MTLRKVILSLGLLSAAGVCAADTDVPADQPQPLTLAQRWSRPVACVEDRHLPPAMLRALQGYCLPFPDPEAKKAEIINRLVRSNVCYYAVTQEDYERMIRMYDMLPPSLLDLNVDERYRHDNTVFVGAGTVSAASTRAQPVSLTYSFPADGVTWGTGSFGTGANVLANKLSGFFGVGNIDRARELIRQALANWRLYGGITYTEVADDNTVETTVPGRVATRGDIRIGSYPLDGVFNVLAYNNFTISGSDMNLDADDFAAGSFYASGSSYRFFRNVVAHEHGHGMSYIHTVPCNNTKLMEPQASSAFEMLQIDDRRGIQRNYGDHFAGNNNVANARNFGNLTSPVVRSVIRRDLSTNGSAGFNGTSNDWFKFTLGSAQTVTITVTPTGGSYTEGQQSSGCSGTTSTVVASQAGNLNVELYDSAGVTNLFPAQGNVNGAGTAETINAGSLGANTYAVRVVDVGPNANQTVQTYDITIRVGSSFAYPQAIAGLNKRIGQGFPCWFRGDINSRSMEGFITNYQWDFENDGIFDASGAEASTSYATPGLRTVRLRVTDSNGNTDEDFITVDVFSAVPPAAPGPFNLLTPANGSNTTNTNPTLDWSDSSNADSYLVYLDNDSDFSSPILNGITTFSSQITLTPGTVFVGNTYYWRIIAVNAFGNTQSTPQTFSFNVVNVPPPCQGDFNNDGQRNSADLTFLLGFFGQSVPPNTNGDLNGDGFVNVVDLTLFLGNFGIPCS